MAKSFSVGKKPQKPVEVTATVNPSPRTDEEAITALEKATRELQERTRVRNENILQAEKDLLVVECADRMDALVAPYLTSPRTREKMDSIRKIKEKYIAAYSAFLEKPTVDEQGNSTCPLPKPKTQKKGAFNDIDVLMMHPEVKLSQMNDPVLAPLSSAFARSLSSSRLQSA